MPTTVLAQVIVTGLAGIYLTASDFQAHRLSYQVADKHLHYKFPAADNMLTVRDATGRKTMFSGSAVYGYRKNDRDYRFVSEANRPASMDGERFVEIRAVAPLYLYSRTLIGYRLYLTYWYYSLTHTSPLRGLTKDNLARDFSAVPALAQEIGDDKQLSRDITIRDPDGQLRVAKILAKYLPAPTK